MTDKYLNVLTINLSTFSDFIQFTGFEHTRLDALLTILGLSSTIVWVTIGFAIVISQVYIQTIRFSQYRHRRPTTKSERQETNHG